MAPLLLLFGRLLRLRLRPRLGLQSSHATQIARRAEGGDEGALVLKLAVSVVLGLMLQQPPVQSLARGRLVCLIPAMLKGPAQALLVKGACVSDVTLRAGRRRRGVGGKEKRRQEGMGWHGSRGGGRSR
jgi:hypothetical protein